MDRSDAADLDRQAKVVGRLDPVDAGGAVPGLVVDGEQDGLPGRAPEVAEDRPEPGAEVDGASPRRPRSTAAKPSRKRESIRVRYDRCSSARMIR